jgi:DNA-binding GntR family transcriptional regulator
MAQDKPSHPSTWLKASSPPGEAHNYLDVRDILAERIKHGELALGERLPSERQMQSGTGAARGTVRAALFQLEAEGLIYRKDRSGWYVAPPPIVYDPTRWEGFMSYVGAQGREPRTETLSVREITATPVLAHIFSTDHGAPLYEIRRRRYIDERAVLVETIHVDPRLAPGLSDHNLDGSLTSVLRDHYGVTVTRNRIEMQPCALTQDEAAALRIKSGLPGLLVKRISSDAQGRIVEYDLEYWRHNALKVSVDTQVG